MDASYEQTYFARYLDEQDGISAATLMSFDVSALKHQLQQYEKLRKNSPRLHCDRVSISRSNG